MHVQLTLKSWKVAQDEKTKLPKLHGSYAVMMGEKEIASQNFNDGYSGKEVPFSGDLIKKTMELETMIKEELEKLIG